MSYPAFRKDTQMFVELGDGLALRSAPERAFGVHYAVYRQTNPDFEDFLEYGSDLEGLNYCFWVQEENRNVAGVIIRPNHIEGMFLIPPKADHFAVLCRALPVLLAWSDKKAPIEAVDVTTQELEMYQRLGFRVTGGRRVYIRPTETLDVAWPSWCTAASPTVVDVPEIAGLFQVAYRGYAGKRLGQMDATEWERRVAKCFTAEVPEVCHRASSLIRDSGSGKVIGVCLVRLACEITRPDVRIPKVVDIAVHPERRRGQIGTCMLRRALTGLAEQFPTLRFGVAIGNPAEAFYYRSGFAASPPQYELALGPIDHTTRVVPAKEDTNAGIA